MDNIESWSRTRRASEHSISMSSESHSRVSSPGLSSFTENLTLYMNGERGLPDSSDCNVPEQSTTNPGILSKDMMGKKEFEDLQKELNASLRKNGELVAENHRLQNDLQRSSIPNSHTLMYERLGEAGLNETSPPESQGQKLIIVEELRNENRELRKRLEQLLASAKESELLTQEVQEAKNQISKLQAAVETARKHSDLQSLRVNELQSDLEKQDVFLQASRDQEMAKNRHLHELESKLESQRTGGQDELDDQSLIEELEDDIERTRHELDRVIKDKERMERQLQFARSDLNFERTRNAELEEQISRAWNSVTCSKPDQLPDSRDQESLKLYAAERLQQLWSAMEKTAQKLDTLGDRFVSKSETLEGQDAEQNPEDVPSVPPLSEVRLHEGEETPMDRAEAYIRKLKAHEQVLKNDLNAANMEKSDLRLQLRESENFCKDAKRQTTTLHQRIRELEEIKHRMGRVLMYQWGKEEVGEIERSDTDGRKEKGMGYRYKYFNKDGTPKTIL